MRNRVSMRFARLRHVQHDDEPPQVKISHPTLKHSSVAFSTGSVRNLDALSALEGRAEVATTSSTTSSSFGGLGDTPKTPKTPRRDDLWAPNSPDASGSRAAAQALSAPKAPEHPERALRMPRATPSGGSGSTSYTTLQSPPMAGNDLEMFYDALSGEGGTGASAGATYRGHTSASTTSPSALPNSSSFADVLRSLDFDDDVPELSESPALLRSSQRESEPREMYVSDDPNWPDLSLGMEMHASDEVYLPKTPARTSSRQFMVEDGPHKRRTSTTGVRSHGGQSGHVASKGGPSIHPSAPSTQPHTKSTLSSAQETPPRPPLPSALPSPGSSQLQTELAQLRKELEQTRNELAAERSARGAEKVAERAREATPSGPVAAVASPSAAAAAAAAAAAHVQAAQPAPPTVPALPRNSIEEYKLALARLNEIRALQIQERDARIALLEAALLRKQMPTPAPVAHRGATPPAEGDECRGRIPRMRMLLPVGE